MAKLEFLQLKPEEITRERLNEELNTLFYQIRYSRGHSPEAQDQLYSCMDGALSVMRLRGELNGSSYEIVTLENGERGHRKKEPADPMVIYQQINQLIDKVNTLVDPNYQSVYKTGGPNGPDMPNAGEGNLPNE